MIRTVINGIETNDPLNLQDLFIELDFTKGTVSQQVSINTWEFGLSERKDIKDAYTVIKNWIKNGVGIFEGVSFQIYIKYRVTEYLLFDGYLDLTTATFDDNKVKCNSYVSGGVDWLSEVSDSKTYQYIYEKEYNSTGFDFIPIPYVVEEVYNPLELIVTSVTTAFVTSQILEQIETIKEMISEIEALDWHSIGKIAQRVAYIATLLPTIIKFINTYMVLDEIRYHSAMRLSDLLNIGCNSFGLKFSSSIITQLESNGGTLCILPEKRDFSLTKNNNGVLGYLRKNDMGVGYYNGTLGDLLVTLRDIFNAEIRIINGVLYLENEQSYGVSTFEITDVDNQEYRYNTDEMYSNYLVSFATDTNDKYSIQNYKGTAYQAITTPITIIDKNKVLTKGLKELQCRWSLVNVKSRLTTKEKAYDVFYKSIGTLINTLIATVNTVTAIVNAAIKLINKIFKVLNGLGLNLKIKVPTIPKIPKTKLGNTIENRLGMMVLENDFVYTPKIMLVDIKSKERNTKPHANNRAVLNAKNVYELFHKTQEFSGSGNNQHVLKQVENYPFVFTDYEKISSNNNIVNGKLLTCKWNPIREIASIEWKEPQTYTNNLKTEYFEP